MRARATRRASALVAALAAVATAPLARADGYQPEVPPDQDLRARVDGLDVVDPGPYEDCVGQSCHIVFRAGVGHDEYLCDMYSASQTAKCVQTTGKESKWGPLFIEESVRDGEDSPPIGGEVEQGPDPQRTDAAEVLGDQSRITFTGSGAQVECWVDGPVVGCRTPQDHGFFMHHNGLGGW